MSCVTWSLKKFYWTVSKLPTLLMDTHRHPLRQSRHCHRSIRRAAKQSYCGLSAAQKTACLLDHLGRQRTNKPSFVMDQLITLKPDLLFLRKMPKYIRDVDNLKDDNDLTYREELVPPT
jgi:hypothetical protein